MKSKPTYAVLAGFAVALALLSGTPVSSRRARAGQLLALLGIEWEPRRRFRPAVVLALVVGVVSLISLIEYAFDQPVLYSFSQYTRMALHTAIVLLVLSAGVLLALGVVLFAIVVLHRDFAQRQRAQEALRESEENLAVTLRSIGDGVLATDAEGGVTALNSVAEKLTGWTEAEAKGRPVAEVFRIINEETRQPAEVPVGKVLASGEIHGLVNHTVLIARDGSERAIADSAAPIRAADGRLLGVVLVFRDVTEERRAEREIRRLNESLEQRVRERTHALETEQALQEHAQKLEQSNRELEALAHKMELTNQALTRKHREQQDFYHTVSHELKTPLTSNREFISIILDGLAGPLTSEQREYLNLAREGCDQIKFCLNDLLDATRLETGKLDVTPAPTRAEELVRKALGSMEPAMQAKGITLRAEVQPGLPEMPLDERRINQVLLNLLSNALKFTPAGGTVVVRAGEDPRQPGWVQMAVSDTGRGIPPEHLTRIFERLYQVRESDTSTEGGLGLGLFIAREIVRLHGGSLWVESEVGRGSTFQFTLPQRWQRRRKTVLFVDDNGVTRELVSDVLEAAGFGVQAVASGQQALEWMRRDAADLAMVDLLMPGMPGPVLIGELRRGWGPLPIIVYTAYPESDLMRQAMEFSPLTLLAKQSPNEKLAATVRAILEPEAAGPAPIGPTPLPHVGRPPPTVDEPNQPTKHNLNSALTL
jgi:PAS domain S-box-containing protein